MSDEVVKQTRPVNGDDRERLRETFDAVADSYDSARPDYPPKLFDDFAEIARLPTGARLLEIGCGTGKATRPLAERGFRIFALELGANLARVARKTFASFPDVEVVNSAFETWDHRPSFFDAVFAATSWHWLDASVKYSKAAALLRPRGALAFWSATHAFPKDFDPFFTEIQDVYDAIGESSEGSWPPPPPEVVPDEAAEILGTGLFEDVVVRRYLWEITYTAQEYIHLLDTFSGHRAMSPENRDRLYAEVRARIARRPSQNVRRHWHSILHVARRP